MQSPRKIEDVKNKIHDRARKMLYHGIWNCLGQWQSRRKSWRQPQEIQWERKESRRTSETPPGTWLGGAQRGGLWLRNGKGGSQVCAIDRSRFPGRSTVGEAGRGGRRGKRASDRANRRVYRFRVRFG